MRCLSGSFSFMLTAIMHPKGFCCRKQIINEKMPQAITYLRYQKKLTDDFNAFEDPRCLLRHVVFIHSEEISNLNLQCTRTMNSRQLQIIIYRIFYLTNYWGNEKKSISFRIRRILSLVAFSVYIRKKWLRYNKRELHIFTTTLT